jgi:hypothetical protein
VSARRKATPIAAGDLVHLTGRYLAFTGQRTGGEGPKRWTVLECTCSLCALGGHVAVNEANTYKGFTAEEIAAEPGLVWRHIARDNLAKLGEATTRHEVPVIGKLPIGA